MPQRLSRIVLTVQNDANNEVGPSNSDLTNFLTEQMMDVLGDPTMRNANASRGQSRIDHDPMPLGLHFNQVFKRIRADISQTPRRLLIAAIMTVALLAFEVFNYDTTRYALNNLLGDVSFMNFGWASILAIAFCSIDFAGLVRIFTPERGRDEPKEVWYLMGAWLLGATMNAMMTWWAVSLTVLNREIGSESIPRETMLKIVPSFVAVLVWLTRILFIGALSVAGEQLMAEHRDAMQRTRRANDAPLEQAQPVVAVRQRQSVHLKERTTGTATVRPRPIARQDMLIVDKPAKPIVAEQPDPPIVEDPLAQLFDTPPRKKMAASPPKKRGVQRPKAGTNRPKTGGILTTNSKLQAKPRQ